MRMEKRLILLNFIIIGISACWGLFEILPDAYEKCSSPYPDPHIKFRWNVSKPCIIDEMNVAGDPVAGWEGCIANN